MATVKLGDIAIETKSSNKGDKTGIRIVGLEHLTPSNVTLSSWSEDTENTFTKEFSKGDVLFGRRRAYLKKAAVAPFDGICSGDITVIRAIEDKVDPDLLPFIIQNDLLFDFAVGKSAGSLSPRVKWTHLKEFAIELPSMPEQSKLAETLWSINETKNAYEDLINKTDELVKSQFIEMFADDEQGSLKDIANIIMGQSPRGETYNDQGEGVPFYQGKTEFSDLYIGEPVMWTTDPMRLAHADDVLMSVRAPVGSTNIAREDCCIGRGLAALQPIDGKSSSLFLIYAMRSIEEDIDRMGVGSTFKAINKDQVHKIPAPITSIDKQDRFVELAEQSDKSKFALQEAIKDLDALSKKIIAENLIPAGKE
ncbi:restriction endonuclease subunit S [Veillonella sp.]|uniref:restriction endonuclease subunit S n=1 Tax=Veillonella sp. TaxID=1926307 RepID=UPI00290E38E5|nr:restriction endonuclease subunit S [Veillonella sp.]MDU5965662.1 restriction endonuclease subunit S [Veillonella sp.]